MRRLAAEPFAGVLLDVGLPGLGGLDVCARLRATGSTIPVIMLPARDRLPAQAVSLHELTTRLVELLAATDGPHRQLIDAA